MHLKPSVCEIDKTILYTIDDAWATSEHPPMTFVFTQAESTDSMGDTMRLYVA